MSVTQLKPQSAASSQRDLCTLNDLLDAIEVETRIAQTIELAITGEAVICGFDPSDLCTLTSAHVERLKAIAKKGEALSSRIRESMPVRS